LFIIFREELYIGYKLLGVISKEIVDFSLSHICTFGISNREYVSIKPKLLHQLQLLSFISVKDPAMFCGTLAKINQFGSKGSSNSIHDSVHLVFIVLLRVIDCGL